MTAGTVNTLTDLMPIQGARLRQPDFMSRVEADDTDPYGHGIDRSGTHGGAVSADAVGTDQPLVTKLLRSLDSSLPDYLIEALHDGLNTGDTGLNDFLGIFDRRLLQLWLQTEQAALTISEADTNTDRKGVIADGLAKLMGGASGAEQLIPVLLGIMAKSRNLDMLRRILEWLFEAPVRVEAKFDHRHLLPEDCRVVISRHAQSNNMLGGGAILGSRSAPASGRLEIEVLCRDGSELTKLQNPQGRIALVPLVTRLFLREQLAVTVYALIERRYLMQPRLSRNARKAARLGPYSCLNPALRPDDSIRVKLDFSKDTQIGGYC